MFSSLSNIISNAFIKWLAKDRPYEGVPLCDFERICYEVRPCDILLIEGRSRVADIIRVITQSSWTHAALYIGRLHDIEDPKLRNLIAIHYKGAPDTQLVIEGLMGEGTVVNPISHYKNDHIRLCRPRGLSRQDAQNVIAYAVHKIGTEYDVRQIVDLGRFLLPWTIMPRRYRSKLFEHNVGESVKTVCSSMLAEAFGSVEFPILPLVKQHAEKGIELITRNPKLYTPRDFDYSPYFDIIKYPFVEFADFALYRRLPWNRQGLVSHDHLGVQPRKVPVKKTENTKTKEPIPSSENIKKKKNHSSTFKRLKERLKSRKLVENKRETEPKVTEDPKNNNNVTGA